MTLLRFIAVCALSALLATPLAHAQEAVGRIVATEGLLVATGADGHSRLVAAGSAVNEGESLSTGSKSYAQIRFYDDAVLVLKPGSRLRVIRYRFEAAQAAHDVIELELLDGAIQSTAGAVSKRSPQALKLHTPGGDVQAAGASFIVSLQGPPAANVP